MKRDKSENALPLTRILAKWRQNPRRKGRASLQVLLPQEVYCSRHCANMQTVKRQQWTTPHAQRNSNRKLAVRKDTK